MLRYWVQLCEYVRTEFSRTHFARAITRIFGSAQFRTRTPSLACVRALPRSPPYLELRYLMRLINVGSSSIIPGGERRNIMRCRLADCVFIALFAGFGAEVAVSAP